MDLSFLQGPNLLIIGGLLIAVFFAVKALRKVVGIVFGILSILKLMDFLQTFSHMIKY